MGFRRGVPLKDRPVVMSGETLPEARREPTRHCWVQGPADASGPFPGVVVEWRNIGVGQWAALVIYVVEEGPSTTVVQAVVDAAYLRPA